MVSNFNADSIYTLLNEQSDIFLEEMAVKAKELTLRHHGRIINLFKPLYISDYCENFCTYCSFRTENSMKRSILCSDEIESNCMKIKEEGIDSIVLLTGESRKYSPPSYIADAVSTASKYFSSIGVEIYPLEKDEYKMLYDAGCDSITIYQETYNKEVYSKVHPKGRKSDYDYRYHAVNRAVEAGFKAATIGALYGLSDPIEEAYNCAVHLQELKRLYPHVEYSVSFPRIKDNPLVSISDKLFLKILLAFRLIFPDIGITISTRESPHIRDGLAGLCITKMSAGSKTNVGGYKPVEYSHNQFDMSDERTVDEIVSMIRAKNIEPVTRNWIYTGGGLD